jgi:hypothetical protein
LQAEVGDRATKLQLVNAAANDVAAGLAGVWWSHRPGVVVPSAAELPCSSAY